jgi:spore maturation protein CgeB
MKILFVGVFDKQGRSTNNSQILAIKKLGHNVVGYNYREKALEISAAARDKHLLNIVRENNFDLVLFSKCNVISLETFRSIGKHAKTCLWFMDPLVSYNEEMRNKTAVVDYICCDKKNVLEEALKINHNSFHIYEGYNQDVDKPREEEKEYDISFIGNIYGNRQQFFEGIIHPIKIISNAYGFNHAAAVSKTKINLNVCTSDGASDRVYKILAAKGFLLTDDWEGREKAFTSGKDLVIYKDIDDLNEKIAYYLENPEEAAKIAENGYKSVQKYNRLEWAKKIIEYSQYV